MIWQSFPFDFFKAQNPFIRFFARWFLLCSIMEMEVLEMKKIMAFIVAITMLCTAPANLPLTYADTYSASSQSELIDVIVDRVKQRIESFSVHYRGRQDLAGVNVLDALTQFNGSEENNMLQSVYGLETINAQYRYLKGTDIQYSFSADYDYDRSKMLRLDADLQSWIDGNLSADMYEPVKAAILSKALSERLLYVFNADRNNAYDGYYGYSTACMGYAELTWHLLKKAGMESKVVIGYTPDGLSDTEYLAKRLTSSELIALSQQDKVAQMQTLHAWNMVRVGSKWYHLDNTWLDGDQRGAQEDGKIHAEYFLGGDGDFGRDHLWIKDEYPTASSNWWDEGSGELRSFLKAYMGTRVFDYPRVESLTQLNSYAEEAFKSGRGSQTFRITQGVQSYAEFPTLGSMDAHANKAYTEYRETPKYPNDAYLLTLEFDGRDPKMKEILPEVLPAVSVTRGNTISPVQLLKNPERSNTAPVKWISLSPAMLNVSGESFTALKEGRAYIGAYTRDEAVIIPVTIGVPQLRVVLNGNVLALSPNPLILNGRTLVPLRGIFEAMGAEVNYDPQKRTITGTRGASSLFLTLGSKNAVINGQNLMLDVPPQIIGDRAFVPARLIAESLGASVEWDGVGNQVIISDMRQ